MIYRQIIQIWMICVDHKSSIFGSGTYLLSFTPPSPSHTPSLFSLLSLLSRTLPPPPSHSPLLPHILSSSLTPSPSPPPSHPAGPPVVEVPSPLIEDDHFGMVFSTLSPPTIPQHLYLKDKTFTPHITSHQITLVVFFFHCKNPRSRSSLPLSSLLFLLLPPLSSLSFSLLPLSSLSFSLLPLFSLSFSLLPLFSLSF